MHQRCMMQTRSIAAGDYEWTEVQAEKIKECEARLTAKLAGFSSLKEERNQATAKLAFGFAERTTRKS